jgi:hypothetical protein
MSYDLAIMALEGLGKSPLAVRVEGDSVIVEGSAASFKEFARLCLLLGGQHLEEEFELQPAVHVTTGSPRVRLRVRYDS